MTIYDTINIVSISYHNNRKIEIVLNNYKGTNNKMPFSMQVSKRDGKMEEVSFDKVLTRIKRCGEGLDVNSTIIAQRILIRIHDGIKTSELDELAAQLSISLMTTHLDYGTLASRIIISNHQKNTNPSFHTTMNMLMNSQIPYLSENFMSYVNTFSKELDDKIDHGRDYLLDYFGFKTLERQKYLLRDINGRVLETPQHMWMRVALALWGERAVKKLQEGGSTIEKVKCLDYVFETYDLISQKYYIHATPTNFNAGTPHQQLSSCYLLSMNDDSIKGIYKTLADCAQISKYAGGIGLHIHNIRAKGSYIAGNGGTSTGIVPMLRNFNATARYVDQGSKRNGSFAIYIEPWHADIEEFLRLKLNTGIEEERARDLFYALWIPDLFMERVEANGIWTLFCPTDAPELAETYGEKFKQVYENYEKSGKGRRQVDAQKLWFKILDSQIETGTPYMLYKDACNEKSNQKNLGIIKSSNLCTEIVEYSSPEETAVCNLASIILPTFVDAKRFDFNKLREVVKIAIRNLNRVIDINFYPTPETRISNTRHRPVGLGVQGLADVFAILRMPWETEKAFELNQKIFEHMYYAALETSSEISAEDGVYDTYVGSPISRGQLQYDLWKPLVIPLTESDGSLDWGILRAKISKYGVRNSLLIAPMPTASTSQIMGSTECFEPLTSNIYTRRTISGEYIVVNKFLMKDLCKRGMWSEDMKNRIIASNGSIQNIDDIPASLKSLYKTNWEIKQKTLIDMAAARGAFICQSQSLNLFVTDPTYAKLTSMHFYSWKKGLKTGLYYLRTKTPVMAQKFTVDPILQKEVERIEAERRLERGEGRCDGGSDGCLVCGS